MNKLISKVKATFDVKYWANHYQNKKGFKSLEVESLGTYQ